jgi:hypothetical protein
MLKGINRRKLLAGAAVTFALGHDLARADPFRKDIDLRNGSGGDPSWVLFFARNPNIAGSSFAGHAFVGVGSEDSQQQMSWIKAFGLYPKNDIAGGLSALIGPVPGELKKDAWSKSDVVLSCRVSAPGFQAVNGIIDRWTAKTNNGSAEYQLMYQDCVSFVLEAAGALGMNLPPRANAPDTMLLPVTHIRKLADLNN